ncbi:hypothetical protein [Bacillus nakamurai]|uniref:hypothetical protein n=1 Tax=Bacillus nakamurai TaxID=1793963 RepID=UPI001E4EEDC8|nr:hypothetical protein [Bacillus nakamurai]MCC9021484.1 hypothetical protein [Bacillus nakamurai]
MGEASHFVTKEEMERIIDSVCIFEWVIEKVLQGEIDFTKEQEAKIVEASEVLGQCSEEELLLYFNRPKDGDKE